MNFGVSFISWIKTLYFDIKGCVKNNNWITEKYDFTRGIRQGCPMSCLIFVLAIEYLATRIKHNINIEGFKIGNRSVKIAQLADDTMYKEVATALKIVEEFGKLSGLQLNKNKTEGLLYIDTRKE